MQNNYKIEMDNVHSSNPFSSSDTNMFNKKNYCFLLQNKQIYWTIVKWENEWNKSIFFMKDWKKMNHLQQWTKKLKIHTADNKLWICFLWKNWIFYRKYTKNSLLIFRKMSSMPEKL